MNKLWVCIGSAISLLVALIIAFTKGKSAGKVEIENKQNKETLKNGLAIKKSNENLHSNSTSDIDNILLKDARD
jgi:hypothetical protein